MYQVGAFTLVIGPAIMIIMQEIVHAIVHAIATVE